MRMKKIVTVIGARPQFIKAALVSRILKESKTLNEIIIHTGQHYDANMSKIFFDELTIPNAQYHLGVGSGSHGKQTGEMIAAIENVLIREKPNVLLIYGDTNSTLAAALAAAKLSIPIAHVEAGLRSHNRKMPEEINRLIADQLSDILFTPTQLAFNNLKLEGYNEACIVPVGDVMYDAALYFAEKATEQSHILDVLALTNKKYILATLHRAENTDTQAILHAVFQSLERLCNTLPIIMPLHPRTRKLLEQTKIISFTDTPIHIIEPIGFLDMLTLEKNAALIMTDSGGIQKEAFFYKVPCLTLRSETEWVETVQLGWNRLINPADQEAIYQYALFSLGTKGMHDQFPYGHGNASQLIVDYLQTI
jgi:UDP-GlcNAc3NAcA epimerase